MNFQFSPNLMPQMRAIEEKCDDIIDTGKGENEGFWDC